MENDDNPFVESDDCDFGHGTAVSAVIGASRNNGVGIAGAADVDIVPVRALDCELGFESDVVKGMHYLLSLQGTPLEVDVINLSLGGEGDCSSEMQEAVDLATSFNIPVIVAAGNKGWKHRCRHRLTVKMSLPLARSLITTRMAKAMTLQVFLITAMLSQFQHKANLLLPPTK